MCESVSPASMTENKTDSAKMIEEIITPNTSDKEATQSKFPFYIFPHIMAFYILL